MIVRVTMLPRDAILHAIKMVEDHKDFPAHGPDIVESLEHARDCLKDMANLLRFIRDRLPTYEPGIHKMITSQLLRGCDV
jgi:hypothetical protein